MSNEKNQSGKPDKKQMQIRQQIFHNLLEIAEIFPQYNVVQHMATIIRKKDSDEKEFYYWSEEFFLKRIEQHKEELEGDQFMNLEDGDSEIIIY